MARLFSPGTALRRLLFWRFTNAICHQADVWMKILIAGASSGIGRFLAERLLGAGHNVWGFARSSGDALAHARFRAFRCDVAEWDEVDRLANKIEAETQRLDAIIVCAAL